MNQNKFKPLSFFILNHLINDKIINLLGIDVSEEKVAEIEKIQEMSLSYRIYLLSRRDFVSGVLIGVFSSLSIGYLTQIDNLFSNQNLTFSAVIIRLLVSSSVLGYLLYNHRKRTDAYETLLKKMSQRTQRLTEELKK